MIVFRYNYGAPTDYDEWAAIQKDQPGGEEWSYKEFHPCVVASLLISIFRPIADGISIAYVRYFLKYEKFNPSHLFPGVDPTLRGAKGLVNSKLLYVVIADLCLTCWQSDTLPTTENTPRISWRRVSPLESSTALMLTLTKAVLVSQRLVLPS